MTSAEASPAAAMQSRLETAWGTGKRLRRLLLWAAMVAAAAGIALYLHSLSR